MSNVTPFAGRVKELVDTRMAERREVITPTKRSPTRIFFSKIIETIRERGRAPAKESRDEKLAKQASRLLLEEDMAVLKELRARLKGAAQASTTEQTIEAYDENEGRLKEIFERLGKLEYGHGKMPDSDGFKRQHMEFDKKLLAIVNDLNAITFPSSDVDAKRKALNGLERVYKSEMEKRKKIIEESARGLKRNIESIYLEEEKKFVEGVMGMVDLNSAYGFGRVVGDPGIGVVGLKEEQKMPVDGGEPVPKELIEFTKCKLRQSFYRWCFSSAKNIELKQPEGRDRHQANKFAKLRKIAEMLGGIGAEIGRAIDIHEKNHVVYGTLMFGEIKEDAVFVKKRRQLFYLRLGDLGKIANQFTNKESSTGEYRLIVHKRLLDEYDLMASFWQVLGEVADAISKSMDERDGHFRRIRKAEVDVHMGRDMGFPLISTKFEKELEVLTEHSDILKISRDRMKKTKKRRFAEIEKTCFGGVLAATAQRENRYNKLRETMLKDKEMVSKAIERVRKGMSSGREAMFEMDKAVASEIEFLKNEIERMKVDLEAAN